MKLELLKELLLASNLEAFECESLLVKSATTSLIVNDAMDGKIMRVGEYFYNLVNDMVVDLTVDQNKDIDYENGEEVTRETLLSNEDIKKMYGELLRKVRSDLLIKDSEKIDNDERLKKYEYYLKSLLKTLHDKFYFSDYDIDTYYIDNNAEYTRLILDFVTSGTIIDLKHYLREDKYEYSVCAYGFEVDPLDFPLPKRLLESIFDIARENKDNISLEESLGLAYNRQ